MTIGIARLTAPRRVLLCVTSVVLGVVALAAPSQGAKFKEIYAFCAEDNCPDGSYPTGALVRDAQGNLYGTTYYSEFGSAAGTVFVILPDGQQQTLHAFGQGDDGGEPQGSLVMDVKGNLYGTTYSGGVGRQGIAFEMIHSGKKWKYAKLYDFCARDQCADGGNPGKLTYAGAATGALYDGTSPLYGTAYNYGPNINGGAVFELDVMAGKNKRREKIVYGFCSQISCADGAAPTGIAFDKQGNIFGATGEGGANNHGALFQISGKTETVLYSFCPGNDCSKGNFPQGVSIDANGNLLGVTTSGGAQDQGTVFQFTPSTDTFKMLHDFCSSETCADGALPLGGVTVGPNGDLFGTTLHGGMDQSCCGVAYALHGNKEKVLHTFCATDCSDGSDPQSEPIFDQSGNMYGTTTGGGDAHGGGVVWQMKP